jgi:hypothetical protein
MFYDLAKRGNCCDKENSIPMPPQKLKATNEPLHPIYIPNESNGQRKIQSRASLSENRVLGCACPVSAKRELL